MVTFDCSFFISIACFEVSPLLVSPNIGAFVEREYWPTWLAKEFSFGGKNSPMFWSGGCAKYFDCEWSDISDNIGVDNRDFP